MTKIASVFCEAVMLVPCMLIYDMIICVIYIRQLHPQNYTRYVIYYLFV